MRYLFAFTGLFLLLGGETTFPSSVKFVAADTTTSWPSLGGSSFRLSQATISLPDPNTGIAITQRISFDNLVLTYPPLVTVDSVTILVIHNDTVIFLDSNYEELLSVNVTVICGNIISALPVLDTDHTSIILPIVRISQSNVGGGACSISTSLPTLGKLLWSTEDIQVETFVEPLLINQAVWFIGYDGNIAKIDTITGTRILIGTVQLCSNIPSSSLSSFSLYSASFTDQITSPPTQLYPGISSTPPPRKNSRNLYTKSTVSSLRTYSSVSNTGGLFIVSSNGCVTSIDDTTGKVLWTVPNTNLPFVTTPMTMVVNAAPVVDTGRNQGYWLYNQGIICCISTLNGTQCNLWSSVCVPFSSSTTNGTFPLPVNVNTGLSVSPNTLDFHNGRLYCIGSDGTLYAIAADTGTVYASSPGLISNGISYTTPLIIPNGWGNRNHGLITVSSSSKDSSAIIGAWEIGNNGQEGDDDPTDDDGQGTTGYVWELHLPLDTGNILCPGISVLSDNRLIVITTSGDVVVLGSASNAVEIDDPWVESVIITGVLIVSLSMVGGGYYIAHRQRMAAVSLELEGNQDQEELLLSKEGMDNETTNQDTKNNPVSVSTKSKSIQ